MGGSQFGSYFLDEPLATGGMARVYRARLRGLGGFEKPLVVKQVLPELASDPRFVEMFVAEANTLVRMSHPHIVSVYELGVVEGIYFLAMEYVDGATIATILQDGPLPPPLVAQLSVQICDALEYAHSRFAILHRDVSPRNIIVDGTGNARLLDFGVSTHIDSIEHSGFGSPGYTAPEQVLRETTSARSDLFSLGAVLFEALSGRRAFLRQDSAATRRALLDEPPPRLDRNTCPEALANLVESLLARDPQARPASAAAVAQKLRGWLSQHAPEGVFGALIERVERARLAGQTPTEPTRTSDVPSLGATGPVPSKTLATNPLLDEARRKSAPKPIPVPTGSTRPITGRKPVPRAPTSSASRPGSTPPTTRNHAWEAAENPTVANRRHWLWAFALSVVIVAAVLYARRPSPAPTAPELPTAPPPTEPSASVRENAAREEPATPPPPPTTQGKAPAAPAQNAASPAAPGLLSVNALPWAELRIDGRDAGTTPVRGLRLKAGAHTLTLNCPPLARTAKVPVTLRSGATTRVVVDLQRDPPDVRVE